MCIIFYKSFFSLHIVYYILGSKTGFKEWIIHVVLGNFLFLFPPTQDGLALCHGCLIEAAYSVSLPIEKSGVRYKYQVKELINTLLLATCTYEKT